jgi:hypothetical protein
MPNNTDNSGSGRASRMRRIAASRGPIPAVRPNIGSMAWDAQLGKQECCDCKFNWVDSPIQLAFQRSDGIFRFFTGVFAFATGTVVPAFGIPVPSPCPGKTANIETQYSNRSGVLSIVFKAASTSPAYIPATITQQIFLTVTCDGITTNHTKTITFIVPAEYRTAC